MKLTLLRLLVSLALVGCVPVSEPLSSSGDDTSGDPSQVEEFSFSFFDEAKIREEDELQSSGVADPNLGGIYFGKLEAIAYSYRPGEEIQSHNLPNGFRGVDWSYWILLRSGLEHVLKPGEKIDFSKIDENQELPVDPNFILKVGKFSIDFLEIFIYRPGIVYGGNFYGNGIVSNPNPLYRFPEWSSIPQFLNANPGVGGFAGFPGHGAANDQTQRVSVFSILFARSDWFPEPVLVYTDDRQLISTSKPLSAMQLEVLTSLRVQNPQRMFGNVYVVPFDHQVLGLKKSILKAGLKGSSDIRISFDLDDVFEAGSTFNGDSSVIKFKRDANNVPLGLSLTFKEKK